MRKFFTFLIINFSFFVIAQNLDLKNTVDKNYELPQELLKNDVGIIYEINGGWSAYDYVNYYFIDGNGNINSYSEEKPKTYLKNDTLKRSIKKVELTQESKYKIIQLLNSNQLSELLKYRQEDFKIKVNENLPPPCYISDQIGYKLTFIQNNKQNSYNYYAPKYFYEKCPHKTINKAMLKKFIDVLALF